MADEPVGRAYFEAFKQDVFARIEALELRMLERLEKSETSLLKEFRKWALITESRLRVNEVGTGGLTERMAALESRMADLEQR